MSFSVGLLPKMSSLHTGLVAMTIAGPNTAQAATARAHVRPGSTSPAVLTHVALAALHDHLAVGQHSRAPN